MNIGKLNRQITIETPVNTVDSYGQPSTSWTLFGKYFADIKNISGVGFIRGERVSADKEVSTSSYSMRVRYNPAIKANMRVLYNSQVFEIRQVLHDQSKHAYSDIVAEMMP